MNQYLGSHVSLDCGEVLGSFQGKVTHIDNSTQTISIITPFRNGIQCEVDTITINACDIKDLKILKPTALIPSVVDRHVHKSGESIISGVNNLALHPASDGKSPQPAPVVGVMNGVSPSKQQRKNRQSPTKSMRQLTPTKAIAIQRHVNEVTNGSYEAGHQIHHQGGGYNGTMSNGHLSANHINTNNQQRQSPNTHINHQRCTPSYINSSEDELEFGNRDSRTPRKIQNGDQRHQVNRSLSSSAPPDSYLLDNDFDFEKNLALFDKGAVMKEIEGQRFKVTSSKKREVRYRCDENVLDPGPVIYHRILVPSDDEDTDMHYVTDCALVVPCVSSSLRDSVISTAEQCGLTSARQTEMLGRSATEMILQLIGGGHRFGPKNAHQRPCVVILCGEHRRGAAGLNTARQLACHNVDVRVHFIESARTTLNRVVMEELTLVKTFNIKIISSLKDFPTCAVDMIVNCMDSADSADSSNRSAQCIDLIQWCNQNKANVLSIDPPNRTPVIKSHWALGVGLPLGLSEAWGKPYLCDVGIPPFVYKQLGITYQSPFAHKFYIPLHSSNSIG